MTLCTLFLLIVESGVFEIFGFSDVCQGMISGGNPGMVFVKEWWQVIYMKIFANDYTLPETNIAPETLPTLGEKWPHSKGKYSLHGASGLGLEDEFPFGARPPARCELLVFGSVS